MLMKNISIKKIYKNKMTYIVIALCVLLTSLSVYTLKIIDGYIFGMEIKTIFGNDILSKGIFSAKSYYSEMEATIISKNINTYIIKEWKKEDKCRYEFIDAGGGKVVVIQNNNVCYIYNEEQKSNLKLENYMDSETNLLSINTYVNIINNLKQNSQNKSCDSKYEIREKKKEKKYIINISATNMKNKLCKCCNLLNKLNVDKIKIELVLDKNKITPIEYVVYNEKNEQSIVAIYNIFKLNEKIEDNIFNIY